MCKHVIHPLDVGSSFLTYLRSFVACFISLVPLSLSMRTRARPTGTIPDEDDPGAPIAGLSRDSAASPLLDPAARACNAEPGPVPVASQSRVVTPSRVSLSEAAAAVENVPGIVLCPPSDENGNSISLFTPSHARAVSHPLSGGLEDPSPATLPRRRRKWARPPSPATSQVAPPSGVILKILGRAHISTVSEHLLNRDSPPAEESHKESARAFFVDISKGLDLSKPEVVTSLKAVLVAIAPDFDFSPFLPPQHLGMFTPSPPLLFLSRPTLHHIVSPCAFHLHLPHLTPLLPYLTFTVPHLISLFLYLHLTFTSPLPHPFMFFLLLLTNFLHCFLLVCWCTPPAPPPLPFVRSADFFSYLKKISQTLLPACSFQVFNSPQRLLQSSARSPQTQFSCMGTTWAFPPRSSRS